MKTTPLDLLKYHVTGAIERGEGVAITSVVAKRENTEEILEHVNTMLDQWRMCEASGIEFNSRPWLARLNQLEANRHED